MQTKIKILKPLLTGMFVLFLVSVFGQVTKIMGRVIDSDTKEPIPFVNIFFKGTTIGVTSDFDGNYSLETKTPGDTLVASYVGYKSQHRKIYKNRFQTIDFELESKNIDLPEVVIHAGENPAEILLRKIIANKDSNSRNEFEAYQYESYNKIEVDANNITEKFQNRRILRPFKFIFDYMDTSTVNGKTYLPIFLSETLSDFYFRKYPKSEKEVIKATKVSGVENESVSQFLGDMFQSYNFYDNYITIFQKNFVSPIANFGLNFYKYYLVDSTYIGNKWCYNIMFKPRRKQELTFTGNFWVHDTTFAIKSFDIRIAEDANINYLNDLVLKQDFELIDGKYWMVIKDYGIGDFNIMDNNKTMLGFFGKKTTTYKNFVFDELKDKKFYSMPTNVIITEKAYTQDEDYWKINRHESLTKDEKTIYNMVDTLKNLPAFKTWIDIFETVITGYYELNKFEIGPYASLMSFNAIEGVRFRLGGQTTGEFNEQIRLDGHVAYGTLDKRFKYGVGLLYLPNKNPRRAIGGNYKYDIEQLGNSPNAFREDFFLAALFRRNPANKLSMTSEYHFYYEHEWFNGFSNKLNLIHKEIIPLGDEKVLLYDDSGEVISKDKITTSEIRLDSRFAFNEKFLMGDFIRISVGTKYPIIGIQYSYGIPGFLGGEYEYHKLNIGIRHWFNVLNIGWSRYIVEVGKVWGTLPFPLLVLHPGNETYFYDEYAFNLMNYFEFVSDQYLSVYYTHHFDGFFLNRIPLMRKLKWREVGYFRGVIGTLSDKNKNYNKLPENTHTLDRPYMEAGVGIENIFKVIRVDGIWRLTQLENNNINKFAFFVSLYFTF
ncbi:MAG: carboxypeptidase-like regulatory domain-containing protein [Bacteroidales bacterium]|nr:carboxypeptidase-like regulatory domain-containing protein [Bacteroidales bacterium]